MYLSVQHNHSNFVTTVTNKNQTLLLPYKLIKHVGNYGQPWAIILRQLHNFTSLHKQNSGRQEARKIYFVISFENNISYSMASHNMMCVISLHRINCFMIITHTYVYSYICRCCNMEGCGHFNDLFIQI